MVSWKSSPATAGLLWADTLILGRMTTTEDVGVYTVATRLVMLAVFVMAPINAAFAPQIARLHHRGDVTRLGEVYAAATAWILRFALPAFVLLLIFPAPLLRLFGDDYVVGAGVTMTLAVGQLVNAATGPCATVLNMSGRVLLNMVNNVAVLALNVGLNLVLIPRLGILGAALAWSVSLAVVNIVRVVQVRRVLGLLPFGAVTVKSAVAAVAAGAAGWAVRVIVTDEWLQLGLGVVAVFVVFVGVVVALGVDDTDRVMLASVLARLRPERTATTVVGDPGSIGTPERRRRD